MSNGTSDIAMKEVGICNLCGGFVRVLKYWSGAFVNQNKPTCERCGATEKKPALPVMSMEKRTLVGVTHAVGTLPRSEEAIDRLINHHKILHERHLADSTNYQAKLFHAWKSLAQQQKGLRRQAKKIKRLQQKLEIKNEAVIGVVVSAVTIAGGTTTTGPHTIGYV